MVCFVLMYSEKTKCKIYEKTYLSYRDFLFDIHTIITLGRVSFAIFLSNSGDKLFFIYFISLRSLVRIQPNFILVIVSFIIFPEISKHA